MPLTCPRCLRKIVDSANPDETPLFCMYCGQKLRSSSGSDAQIVMPDMKAVQSDHDNAATLAFIPAESPSATARNSPSPEPQTNTFDGSSSGTTESTVNAIAGYLFIRFLGAGGMGTVYEAESTNTGQRVAVKLLSSRLAANPSSVERFRQEGRVASQITHPRCVFVLSADTEAGRPYIVMELMPGKTLKDLVDQKGTLACSEAIDRILDAIDGLCEAHRLGVIHRDIKPSNCFLTEDDRVKIGDFGLSKSLTPDDDQQKQLTSSGAFLGTVMYASPEQIRGEPVGYDSDVYALCGTLYFLLTGKAPFQHESLTASLAKAVSEDAPPIRPRRPDVPVELERVVLRGLERDRKRRWQSLDDLRDALADLQPEKQQPARPRAMVLAYIIDFIVLEILIVPVEFIRQFVLGFGIDTAASNVNFNIAEMSWVGILITILYFTLQEGLFGTTIGKRVVRLRVRRLRQMGPPGLWAAFIRTSIFSLIWLAMFQVPEWAVEQLGATGSVLGIGFVSLAIAALCVQLRRTSEGWRGLHDFASKCRVIQRPRPPHRPNLVSEFPNPLDRVQPTQQEFPAVIGGFTISGKITNLPDGGEVWAADDRSLGRRVLIHILAPNQTSRHHTPSESVRPTRLRVLGHGTFALNQATPTGSQIVLRSWIGYVAPAGSPLADVVTPASPLTWTDTRPLLEQLTNELIRAEEDETQIAKLTIEQVWVEPGGRLQVLEFPLPTGQGGLVLPATCQPVDSPLTLVRQVATLALEGAPRNTPAPIRAPIPPHAAVITNRLMQIIRGYQERNLEELRRDLVDNHVHPPEVTTSIRGTHLSVLGLMLSFGLLLMYLPSGLFGLMFSLSIVGREAGSLETERVYADPQMRADLQARVEALPDTSKMRQDILKSLAPENLNQTFAKFEITRKEREASEHIARRFLSRPERVILDRIVHNTESPEAEKKAFNGKNISLAMVHAEIQLQNLPQERAGVVGQTIRRVIAVTVSCILVGVPLMWATFAFLFRGGLSFTLAGVTIVRNNGRLAGRFRCAVRELLVWLPISGMLGITLWIQAMHPAWVTTRVICFIIAVSMLPLYIAIALRCPSQPPQDRIMGTHIVPR